MHGVHQIFYNEVRQFSNRHRSKEKEDLNCKSIGFLSLSLKKELTLSLTADISN